MKPGPLKLLLHPLFLFSLILLLVNDFYLKYTYHNWLTGKLSDITGLFAFSVFILVFTPNYRKAVLISIGLFFLWWKSEFSEPLITFLNATVHIPVHRVIDYSDYIALIIIPCASLIKPIHHSPKIIEIIATWTVCLLSLFSFTATTMIRRLTDDNRVKLDKYVHTRKNKNEIIKSLEQQGLNPIPIPAIYERDWRPNLYVESQGRSGDTVKIPLDSLYKRIYKKIDYGSSYTIPKMYVDGDSIFNLQFLISAEEGRRKEIWLHSFEYRLKPDTSIVEIHYNPLEFSGYSVSRKLGKPVKKKFKGIIKNK